jgi:pimeloyl-ACP methyl ester carboxylesterase
MIAVQFDRLGVGTVDMRYAHAGPADASTAVVFVHGNPGSADDWTSLVTALGEHGRAVALDMPDFGQTVAAPGFQHTVEGYAGFLDQALSALGIARSHLVLHDFGGPFGLAWAGAHLDALASVTLIDTGVLPGYRWHVLARIWRTPFLGEAFQAITTRRAFRASISRGEPRGLPRSFVDGMYDHYDRRTKRAVLKLYRATDDPGGGGELARAFAALDIPALVIWGEHDRYLPASYAARQRDAFPSADVHVLPASGHWPHADAPDTVQQLLVEFLAPKLSATTRTAPG